MVVGTLQTMLEDTEAKSDRGAILRKGKRAPVNAMVDQNIKIGWKQMEFPHLVKNLCHKVWK